MTHLSPALSVECPTCDAYPGEDCIALGTGLATTFEALPHATRLAALEERNRETGTIR